MPELPEVETVKRGLDKILHLDCGETPLIRLAKKNRKDLREPMPKNISSLLKDQKLLSIQRRAKYLIFEFPNGAMVNHLGMTGTWREESMDSEKRSHDHFELQVDEGKKLVFNDPRRFGLIIWSKDWKSLPRIKQLGPEPNTGELSFDYLWSKIRKKKVAIKNAIMDQKVVVGVGNIYASEALYRAGIRPQKKSDRVTKGQTEKLVHSICEVIAEAIEAGGSTISDFKQAGGESGYFQHKFQVYGREDELCSICSDKIIKKTIGGRSSFYCPSCQS